MLREIKETDNGIQDIINDCNLQQGALKYNLSLIMKKIPSDNMHVCNISIFNMFALCYIPNDHIHRISLIKKNVKQY